MDARILLVEDDHDLRVAMASALAADGHQVDTAENGVAALDALAARPPDLVLLDVGLGAGPDGIEVCRRLRRADADTYVMMLTARDAEADAVLALEAGADDYVTKPVGIVELRSRVRAALRRLGRAARTTGGDERELRHEALALEPTARRIRVGAEVVTSSRSEYSLLEALLRADGAVRSRHQLLDAIYGDGAYRDPHGIDVHVHHLRDKLESAGGDPGWIVTVRGIGYRLGP